MPTKNRSSVDMSIAAPATENDPAEPEQQPTIPSTAAKATALPLSQIIDRVTDTREVKSKHVEDLMLSIATLGLLEPLVLDRRQRLLAGGHRKAAIHLLKEKMPGAYAEHFPQELVPVRILDFDADQNSDLALQIEIAENEIRRDYTAKEVRTLAERLKAAGYVDPKGRPAAGEKALRPALQVIIGKSIRTIQRYLKESEGESTTSVVLSHSTKALGSLRSSLAKWRKTYGESDDQAVRSINQEVTSLLDRLTKIDT
jgi:ParB family transcriptional regulator, chromosome partitioning protein